jgi:peroxiredoxin Q/BCP
VAESPQSVVDHSAILGFMLTAGQPAPDISLTNQHGDEVSLRTFRGRRVMVFFYPKANTPGCTQQACALRDIAAQVGDTVILGISPDKPSAQQKFDEKYGLGYPLLADVEHTVAEAYGVWQEKNNYGKKYMGIVRSAFLIDPKGKIEQAWYKISPKDTPVKLLEALQA